MGECSSKNWPGGKTFLKKKLTRAKSEALIPNSEALTPSDAAAIMAAMAESAGEEVWNNDRYTNTTEVDQQDAVVLSTIIEEHEHDLDEDGTASLSCIIATSKLAEGKYDHSMACGGASANPHPGSSSESFEYVQYSDACFSKYETELMIPTALAQPTVLTDPTWTESIARLSEQLRLPPRDKEGSEQLQFQPTCINMAEASHTSGENTAMDIKKDIAPAEDPSIQTVHACSSPEKECKNESHTLTQSSAIADTGNLMDEAKWILTNTAFLNISQEVS